MRRFKDHPLVGRWRIAKADLWDADHPDLCGPAMIVIRADGTGEEVVLNARRERSSKAC